jgi:hypothetical protein
MTAPKSIDAYLDCEEHFQRALSAPNGIAITVATPGLAVQLRGKMNSYRELLRRQSRAIYEKNDSERYSRSPYDAFKLTIDENNPCRVIIKRNKIEIQSVEELRED